MFVTTLFIAFLLNAHDAFSQNVPVPLVCEVGSSFKNIIVMVPAGLLSGIQSQLNVQKGFKKICSDVNAYSTIFSDVATDVAPCYPTSEGNHEEVIKKLLNNLCKGADDTFDCTLKSSSSSSNIAECIKLILMSRGHLEGCSRYSAYSNCILKNLNKKCDGTQKIETFIHGLGKDVLSCGRDARQSVATGIDKLSNGLLITIVSASILHVITE